MSEKKRRPVAMCTRCGAFVYETAQIDQLCTKRPNGKRCLGAFGSSLLVAGWNECPECQATGVSNHERCRECDGSGWSFVGLERV